MNALTPPLIFRLGYDDGVSSTNASSSPGAPLKPPVLKTWIVPPPSPISGTVVRDAVLQEPPAMQAQANHLHNACAESLTIKEILKAEQLRYAQAVESIVSAQTQGAAQTAASRVLTKRQGAMLWACLLYQSPRLTQLAGLNDPLSPLVTKLQQFNLARFEHCTGRFLRNLMTALIKRFPVCRPIDTQEMELLRADLCKNIGLTDLHARTVVSCWAGALESASGLYPGAPLSSPAPAQYVRRCYAVLYRQTFPPQRGEQDAVPGVGINVAVAGWERLTTLYLERGLDNDDQQTAALLDDPADFLDDFDRLCLSRSDDPTWHWGYSEELCQFTGLPWPVANVLSNAWQQTTRTHADSTTTEMDRAFAALLISSSDASRPMASIHDPCPGFQSPLLGQCIQTMHARVSAWCVRTCKHAQPQDAQTASRVAQVTEMADATAQKRPREQLVQRQSEGDQSAKRLRIV